MSAGSDADLLYLEAALPWRRCDSTRCRTGTQAPSLHLL